MPKAEPEPARPTMMEWTEIQRRADIHGNGASVHAVQTLLRWMGELFNAPTWSQAHAQLWRLYEQSVNAELLGCKAGRKQL